MSRALEVLSLLDNESVVKILELANRQLQEAGGFAWDLGAEIARLTKERDAALKAAQTGATEDSLQLVALANERISNAAEMGMQDARDAARFEYAHEIQDLRNRVAELESDKDLSMRREDEYGLALSKAQKRIAELTEAATQFIDDPHSPFTYSLLNSVLLDPNAYSPTNRNESE